jgi:small subunit ribosomal protein S7
MDGNKADAAESTSFANLVSLGQMENIAAGGHGTDPVTVDTVGHKYGLPELPLPKNANFKYRYDPIVDQITNLLMKDGKLSVAQRVGSSAFLFSFCDAVLRKLLSGIEMLMLPWYQNMSFILNHLRTAPPPVPNPARPLLPGSPPPTHLPLNPIGYLTVAIDSVAPVLRIRSQRGAAGGGAALQIPVPLGLRQRRRQAVEWILDAANKKKSRGSGRNQFALRVADEIISVVEGKSSVWEKRQLVHKTGTSARANLNYRPGGRR